MTALIHVEETPITPLLLRTGFPELYYDVSHMCGGSPWLTDTASINCQAPYKTRIMWQIQMTGQQEARIHLSSHRLLVLPNIDIDRQAEYALIKVPVNSKHQTSNKYKYHQFVLHCTDIKMLLLSKRSMTSWVNYLGFMTCVTVIFPFCWWTRPAFYL